MRVLNSGEPWMRCVLLLPGFIHPCKSKYSISTLGLDATLGQSDRSLPSIVALLIVTG